MAIYIDNLTDGEENIIYPITVTDAVYNQDNSEKLSDTIKALSTEVSKKQDEIKGAGSTITSSNLGANKVVISNSSGKIATSDITPTELSYLDGVTSNIQTQLNSKVSSVPVISVNGKIGAVALSASDVGALSLAGGELSGNIKIKNENNAYYELNDGTTRWFLQCYEGNCGIGPSWKDATVWTPDGDMTVKGGVTVNDDLTVGGATISRGTSAEIIGETKQATTISNQIVLQKGAVFSGTAAAAGLVTRGICGVTTPENNGACQKENLYVNYDSTNEYNVNRQLVLQAGSVGAHYGNNLYQYAAARGDAVKNWVESKGYVASSNVTQTLGNSTTKVPSEKAVQDAIVASGGGDMLKSIYDPNNTVGNSGGIVNYVKSHSPAIAIQSAQPTQTNGDIWFQVT